MNPIVIITAVGLVSFFLSVLVGKAIARGQSLDARLEPYVASELDERTAVHPGAWVELSRDRWPA